MFISAKDFIAQERRKPLKARLLQIAAVNAVGNDSRTAGVVCVATLHASLMRKKR